MASTVKRRLIKLFLLSVLIFLALEVTLRLQQRWGPIVDLKLEKVNHDKESDILNHKCISEYFYDSYAGGIRRFYDQFGIRINKLGSDCTTDCRGFKILFLGDSFMEGLDDAYTIPFCVREYLQHNYAKEFPLVTLNAGCTSYSPSIFIPQAKIVIPLLKPDFVVVDIDETDLGDDTVRYRDLIRRDAEGKIIAVRHSPVHRAFMSGFMEIRKHPLYLMRFILKIYHTRFYMPAYISNYCGKNPRHPVAFSLDKNASPEKYAEEITFFENNLTELAETLIDLMGSKDRILFIYHPYLQHLKPDPTGFYWNNFVSDGIKKICDKYGVAFYDFTEDLRKNFKGKPEKYYFVPDIHFNRRGIKMYGELVAVKILPMIEPFVEAKWPDKD